MAWQRAGGSSRQNEPSQQYKEDFITAPLYSHLGNESVRKIDFYGLTIALTSFRKSKSNLGAFCDDDHEHIWGKEYCKLLWRV